MGRGASRSASLAALGIAVLLVAPGVGAVRVSAAALPPADAVMLTDIGPGWQVREDEPGRSGAHTRTFASADGALLSIIGFPVTRPPGVEVLFRAQVSGDLGLEEIDEPAFRLATWLVDPGTAPGDGGVSALTFASRDHLFTIFLVDTSGRDGPALVRDLARRQIDAAGGEPTVETPQTPRDVDDAELLRLMPDMAPPGYGIGAAAITLSGADELATEGLAVPEAARFLNDRAKNVVRVWGSSDLVVGVGITEYPYEIFAAAGLGIAGEDAVSHLPVDARELPPDAVTFREPDGGQVGLVFRRGHLLYTVYAEWTNAGDEVIATALAVDMAAALADLAPRGDTEPYSFPSPPSRIAGLVLTAVLVFGVVVGTRIVAWWRARRVRRRWATASPPAALPPPGSPLTELVELDTDAAALRRSGAVVALVQLLTVMVGVVALAGDFAVVGVAVAAGALVTGLAFSRWWARRELGLLGPGTPARAFVFPRWPGALLGLITFAVLGVGVAAVLKGLRYLTFQPNLAQLRWSELFGVAPRTVGVIFVVGGFAVTLLGAVLYRAARALSRAGVRRVLAADPRPPALYLRSFDDDSLPLPTIASARRPLFELFSLRGADPFEESVTWELDSYAPVVAVGRPGGTLQSLGAAREHLAQDTWRDQIAARMEQAGLIVLAPGETPGLAWELAAIVSAGHLSKTLFVFPPLAPADLARRWEHTAGLLRAAGAPVGTLAAPVAQVHTVRLGPGGELRATVASTRDEATYRTAVDRSIDPVAPAGVPVSPVAAAVVGGGWS